MQAKETGLIRTKLPKYPIGCRAYVQALNVLKTTPKTVRRNFNDKKINSDTKLRLNPELFHPDAS